MPATPPMTSVSQAEFVAIVARICFWQKREKWYQWKCVSDGKVWITRSFVRRQETAHVPHAPCATPVDTNLLRFIKQVRECLDTRCILAICYHHLSLFTVQSPSRFTPPLIPPSTDSFLDASSHLYIRVRPSVCPSVRSYVHPSIR